MFSAWVSSTDHEAARLSLNSAYAFIYAAERVLAATRQESEISRLNAQSGSPFKVSPLLRDVIAAALEGARMTRGACDPVIPPSDRARRAQPVALGGQFTPLFAPSLTWNDVGFEPEIGLITLPLGSTIDIEMPARAWLAERAADALSRTGPCLIDAGGYLVARGRPERREGWLVGVMDPFHSEQDLVTLEIEDCGVATAAASPGPAGHGAATDLAAVTVIAKDLVTADCFARASLRVGREATSELTRELESVQVLFVPLTGEPVATSQFSRYIAA